MMETGLVLEANFKDLNPPYLRITNPIPTLVMVTNLGTYTVMGVATDDEEIASVNYSLNGGSYGPATTNGIQWTASLASLAEGTNIFDVYALATNGNTSATNSLTIIRNPAITTFVIASNNVALPQAQVQFDGSNYLVVYQGGPRTNTTALGQFVSTNGVLEGTPLALNPDGQDDPPYLDFDGTNYLVAWADYSIQDEALVKGAFVSPVTHQPLETPLTLSQSTTADGFGSVTFGGGFYFLMWADYRNYPSPDSIYGAMINTSGTNVTGDFQISTNGTEGEFAGPQAAFDGTNFLAVWTSGSGNLTLSGQLISPSGTLVGNSFAIYTNSGPTGLTAHSVVFDGTNYLVLFNIGITSASASPGGFQILGRFVTTGGGVLTNRVTLTTDAGPQIIPGVDFDGSDFLASWNQGWNPFSTTSPGKINGRFLNAQGNPSIAEFTIFPSQTGLTWTWAPVLFDGSKYVLVSGLGKQIESAATSSAYMTNSIIYGAFVKP
jgi:hypothetical protein